MNRKIIVVDDDKVSRKTLGAMLSDEGFDVSEVESPMDVRPLVEECPNAILLVDHFMPEQKGFDLLRDLMGDYPDMQCALFSGGNPLVSADKLMTWMEGCGVKHTMTKPFERDKVLAVVNDLVGN